MPMDIEWAWEKGRRERIFDICAQLGNPPADAILYEGHVVDPHSKENTGNRREENDDKRRASIPEHVGIIPESSQAALLFRITCSRSGPMEIRRIGVLASSCTRRT